MPSSSARSIAASMISASVEPSQPNTRYAPNVTPGATPRDRAVRADDAGDVRAVAVAVVRDRRRVRDRVELGEAVVGVVVVADEVPAA